MYLHVTDYTKELPSTLKKTDVIDGIRVADAAYSNTVNPLLEEMLVKVNDDEFNISDAVISNIVKESGMRANNASQFLDELTKYFVMVTDTSSELIDQIDSNMGDVVTRDTVTFKQATLLRISNYYTTIPLFIVDVFDYIVATSKIDGKELDKVTKHKYKDLVMASRDFGASLKFFKEHGKSLKRDIGKISNGIVLGENSDNGISDGINRNTIASFITGFIGNPIYHFRTWLVDRDADKYKMLEERKKLVAARIVQLEAKRQGEDSPRINKQIEYYKNRLATMEYTAQELRG